MDGLEDPESLSDGDLVVRLVGWEEEERDVSSARWVLLDRIDVLRAERVRRLRRRYGVATGEDGGVPPPQASGRARISPVRAAAVFAGTGELPELPLRPLPDLRLVDDDALEDELRRCEAAEDDVALRRRILHHQIDRARAELDRRAADPGA